MRSYLGSKDYFKLLKMNSVSSVSCSARSLALESESKDEEPKDDSERKN